MVPEVAIESVESAAENEDLLATLEHAMSDWTLNLTQAMQRESEKQPQGKGESRQDASLSCLLGSLTYHVGLDALTQGHAYCSLLQG